MATAREMLFEQAVALLSKKFDDESDGTIREILKTYRVQTKPNIKIPDDKTARDALGDRILDIWKNKGKAGEDELGTTIDEFRMQSKAKKSPSKKAAPKKKAAPARAPARPAARTESAPSAPKERPKAPERPGASPVAGGPRRRGKTRSECPKCKSMGVVLARSYAGDEYFSCIYCGWQAYKPVDEDDPNASLAVRLLGSATKKN